MQGRGGDGPCIGRVLRGAGQALRGAARLEGGIRGRRRRQASKLKCAMLGERRVRRGEAQPGGGRCWWPGIGARWTTSGHLIARRARFWFADHAFALPAHGQRVVLYCSGAGDRANFGWDAHLRSVGDERRRQVGRDALHCPIPSCSRAGVHAGRRKECQRNAGRRSDRWAQDEQGEQGAWCERHCVRITGLLSTGRAWRCERASRPCLSVLPKKVFHKL